LGTLGVPPIYALAVGVMLGGVAQLGMQLLALRRLGLMPRMGMSAEAIAALNPDVFLVMSKGLESVGGVDGLIQLPGIAQTQAGKNRAIVAVDDSLLLSFGPRSYSLLAALSQSVERVLTR
jgi:ABC-type Fe3+-hydroxamate transport system substrate-binding protein